MVDGGAGMVNIIVRNLDAGLKHRQRIPVVANGRSMEEEVRDILRTALNRQPAALANLASIIRARLAPLGGVKPDLPARSAMRTPLRFDRGGRSDRPGRQRCPGTDAARSLPSVVAEVAGYGTPSRCLSTISEAGRPITHADGRIAAIARCREASVATQDADDVAWSEVDVINPWDAG